MSEFEPSFDLRLLRSFAAVAEELHFGHAADRLMIAQPALSRQISRLEEQLGARLLERSTRDVTLTVAGQTFFSATRDILRSADRAVAAVRAEHDELTVVVVDGSGPQVRHAVATFMAAHPEITVQLLAGSDAGTSSVIDGDVAATIDLLEALPPELSYAPCVRIPAGIACRASHRLARQASVTWPDLAGESVMLVPEAYSTGYDAFVRNHLRAYDVSVEEVEGRRVNAAMVGAYLLGGRLGVHVCPRHVHEPLPPDLVWVPFEPPVRFEYGVAWRREDDRESVRRFVRWMSTTTGR